MFIEVEKVNTHGVSGKDKILCQVARSQDEGANVYRPTFQVPSEGFLTPAGEGIFTVHAEIEARSEGSKNIVARILSTDGKTKAASIRLHRAFLKEAVPANES